MIKDENLKTALTQQQQLKQRQAMPLADKIELSKRRIKDWYQHWDGDVYISWSKGKDSTVLAHLVWSLFPNVPAVFSDTGLEYPEIKRYMPDFAKDKEVIRVRPKMTHRDVIEQHGFALLSKKWSKAIRVVKENKPEQANVIRLHTEGINRNGKPVKGWTIPKQHQHLITDGVKVSEKCCDILKKEPFKAYEKETGFKPFSGSMAAEGGNRKFSTQTCNAFDGRRPISNPLLFWTEEDVWDYAELHGFKFAEVYYERVNDEGVTLQAEKRTGCMFCMFGVHLEESPNRFQRMALSHPRHHDTCINKLGLNKPLDLINVPYEP